MYESHITVQGISTEEFVSSCKKIGAKSVIIEDDTGSNNQRQMMTAKFHKTEDINLAKTEMYDLAKHFSGHVIRHKLEKIIGKNTQIPEHIYLEFHLKYEIPSNRIDHFSELVANFGGHTSRNVLKQATEGFVYHFATARHFDVYRNLLLGLQEYRKVNSIMECVVFDDNKGLDTNWYGCAECIIKTIPNSLLN